MPAIEQSDGTIPKEVIKSSCYVSTVSVIKIISTCHPLESYFGVHHAQGKGGQSWLK